MFTWHLISILCLRGTKAVTRNHTQIRGSLWFDFISCCHLFGCLFSSLTSSCLVAYSFRNYTQNTLRYRTNRTTWSVRMSLPIIIIIIIITITIITITTITITILIMRLLLLLLLLIIMIIMQLKQIIVWLPTYRPFAN